MDLDEELCLCFHVTRRKVVNYLRIERPRRASQLADCGGAGTGCGWCRPFLERLFDAARSERAEAAAAGTCELPDSAEYARRRGSYLAAGGGKPPPGATPPPAAESPANRPNASGEGASGEAAPGDRPA